MSNKTQRKKALSFSNVFTNEYPPINKQCCLSTYNSHRQHHIFTFSTLQGVYHHYGYYIFALNHFHMNFHHTFYTNLPQNSTTSSCLTDIQTENVQTSVRQLLE